MTRKTRTRAAAADPKRVLADLQRTLVGRLGPGPQGTLAEPAPDDRDPACREFEAELRRLGYGEVEPHNAPPCRHAPDETYTLYVMPAPACFDRAENHADLGWLRFRGCEDCCRGEWHVIECGGRFEVLRVFVGGVDIANTERPQIPPAGRPLRRDEPDEDDEPEPPGS